MNMADELFQTGIFEGMTWWNTNPTKHLFSNGGLSSPYCSMVAGGGEALGVTRSISANLFDMVDSSSTLQDISFDAFNWNHQQIMHGGSCDGDYVNNYNQTSNNNGLIGNNTVIESEEWSSSPPAGTMNSSGTDGSTVTCDAQVPVVNNFHVDPSTLFSNTVLNGEHEILPPCDWIHNGKDQVLGSPFNNELQGQQQQEQIINHIRATLLAASPASSLPPSPKAQSRKTTNSKANNKEDGGDSGSAGSRNASEASFKRQRIETPSPLPTFKVRKEKLGDRITALQQLVSPFGKTDTASVLHEAIEYIKFLHDQVNALSSPYMKNGAPIHHHQHQKKAKGEVRNEDLRSRGLCLVPISSTFPVAQETPADFWTPTTFR